MMKAYRKLKVWQRSMDLVDAVYTLTKNFPSDEKIGLISQLRRAAVSIPSNLAEGSQRGSNKVFANAVSIAYASLAELETQCEIACRQKYCTQRDIDEIFTITTEVGKMLNGLEKSIK